MSVAVETETVPVEWFTEAQVLSLFAQAMRELGYDPLKHGEMRFPTRDEIASRLAAYDGPGHVHRLT